MFGRDVLQSHTFICFYNLNNQITVLVSQSCLINITNCMIKCLKQQTFILSWFCVRSLKSGCQQGLTLKSLGNNLSLPPNRVWLLLAILGIPWLAALSLQSLILSSHGLLSLRICMSSNLPLLRKTPVTGVRPTLIQYDRLST